MNKKKRLISIIGGILVIILVLALIKNGGKNDEIPAETNMVEDGTRKTKYEDFKEALDDSDDPDEFYASKDISMDELTEDGRPMILFFSWENCEPCKEFEPILYEVYQNNPDLIVKDIEIFKIDDFAKNFPVRVTPSIVFLDKDGEAVEFTDDIMEKTNFAVYVDQEDDQKHLYVHEGPVSKEVLQQIVKEMKAL